MLFYIKAASEKTPPCSQSFIKQVVFQDKYNMSLSEAENQEWFQNLKQFCTDWYEQDGLLYMYWEDGSHCCLELSNYGKTWSLDRSELENE